MAVRNNGVSCLVDTFKYMVYFFGPCIVEITICADNYGGQNKNRIIIWFII